MLRDGGALPREAQSEAGRRPECLGSMEVVNCGDVHGDSMKRSNAHVEGKHVCHIILILRALMRFLGYCRAPAGAREDRSRPLLSKS